jgi:hypothetical protein
MDRVDQARELFRKLESQRFEDFGEIAKRAFCIQDKLSKKEKN